MPFPQYRIGSSGGFSNTSFSDTIYFLGGPEIVNFSFMLSGGFGRPDAPGESQGTVLFGNFSEECEFSHCNSNPTGQVALNGTIQVSMSAAAMAFDTLPNDPNNGSNFGFAFLSMGKVVLTDSQGNLITGVPYLSDSGTAYLRDEVLVPEPGTWLTLVGLSVLLIKSKRSPGSTLNRYTQYP